HACVGSQGEPRCEIPVCGATAKNVTASVQIKDHSFREVRAPVQPLARKTRNSTRPYAHAAGQRVIRPRAQLLLPPLVNWGFANSSRRKQLCTDETRLGARHDSTHLRSAPVRAKFYIRY